MFIRQIKKVLYILILLSGIFIFLFIVCSYNEKIFYSVKTDEVVNCSYNLEIFSNFKTDPVVEIYQLTENPPCIGRNISTIALNVSTIIPEWEELDNANWSKHLDHGHWSPKDCDRKDKVAIIIPYRDRESHLKILLNHLHPFLQRQKINYQIFVIEQSADGTFNKGALFNSCFDFVSNNTDGKFTCYIFHDVDMLPIKDQNIYQCLRNPLHLGASVNKFQYKLVYNKIVGGVLAMTPEQFKKVNGYSNIFIGWGGEDDDLAGRIKEEHYKILRYSLNIGKYIMIEHQRDKGNPLNDKRVQTLKDVKGRYKSDGLNSIEYSVVGLNPLKSNLMYWVTVQLPKKFSDQSQIP